MPKHPSTFLLLLSLALLLLLAGCPQDEDPANDDDAAGDDDDSSAAGDDDDSTPPQDDDDDDDEGRATLTGTVTRSVDLVEDGIGNLVFRVRAASGGGGGGIASLTIQDADFTDPEAGVDYKITDIPLSDEGYTVSARLDDNANGGPPDDADLRSERVAITLDEKGTYEVDIVMTLAGGLGGPGDDDDSAGDDDDSAGDDDDSAADDDDSAGD